MASITVEFLQRDGAVVAAQITLCAPPDLASTRYVLPKRTAEWAWLDALGHATAAAARAISQLVSTDEERARVRA